MSFFGFDIFLASVIENVTETWAQVSGFVRGKNFIAKSKNAKTASMFQ
jgi:hypothetical protein